MSQWFTGSSCLTLWLHFSGSPRSYCWPTMCPWNIQKKAMNSLFQTHHCNLLEVNGAQKKKKPVKNPRHALNIQRVRFAHSEAVLKSTCMAPWGASKDRSRKPGRHALFWSLYFTQILPLFTLLRFKKCLFICQVLGWRFWWQRQIVNLLVKD